MRAAHLFRRPPAVDVVEALRRLDDGAILLDVRSTELWRRCHVPGSMNIPLAELETRAEELPEERPVIVFCTGGLLSTGAANLLLELGVDAMHVSRGLIAWRAAGAPLHAIG